MKSKIFLVFVITFFLILSSINTMAFMPKTHLYIFDKSTAEPINTEAYKSCMKHPDLCFAGNQLVDIGVYYYYTQGTKYQTTHSPSFCKLLLENSAKVGGNVEENLACAWGGCTHFAGDLPSHGQNGLVQYSIEHSFLANAIVHVFSEQKIDNILSSRDSYAETQLTGFLQSSSKCQDLFVTSMLGTDAYKDMSKADLDQVYTSYVQEILTSQETGYDPAFKEKSFLGTLDSVPFTLMAIYFIILGIFLILTIILIIRIIRRQAKLRHIIGVLLFGVLFLVMFYFAICMIQGTTFKTFITFIKPVSNLVPIGNPDTYVNLGIQNTRDLFQQGETWLIGKDPSGLGTIPVLTDASSKVMYVDYIVLAVILILFAWFIWFLLKRNKVVQTSNSLF